MVSRPPGAVSVAPAHPTTSRPASTRTRLLSGARALLLSARGNNILNASTGERSPLLARRGGRDIKKDERSPLLARRGGRDIKKNVAKLPLTERTGWWIKLDRVSLNLIHHPVCGAKVASRHFPDAAAT